MAGFLEKVLANAEREIARGYYELSFPDREKKSLAKAIRACSGKIPLIAEVKPFSPSLGPLLFTDPIRAASQMIEGGAVALSTLTEPKFFNGNPTFLKNEFPVPVLQKDFIFDERQFLEGADAILLIQTVLDFRKIDAGELVDSAHLSGFEVLLECHSLEEFRSAKKTKADLLGINNRDLGSLAVSLDTVPRVLSAENKDRPVVAESGLETRADVQKMISAGADAVLVGSSILKSSSIKDKVAELVRL